MIPHVRVGLRIIQASWNAFISILAAPQSTDPTHSFDIPSLPLLRTVPGCYLNFEGIVVGTLESVTLWRDRWNRWQVGLGNTKGKHIRWIPTIDGNG